MSVIIPVGSYKVFLSSRLSDFNKNFTPGEYSKIFILVDENTLRHCFPLLLKSSPALKKAILLEIPSGESYKNLQTCSLLWQKLLEQGADRSSLLINLGGGVIGDMGGFAASAYMRGIAFINLPTTMLAQVDASIGGKLGIDFNDVKNAVGLFKNPDSVFIHPGFLKTLPEDELLSGFAEMVKHALISSQKTWAEIKATNPLIIKNWMPLIHRSLLIKRKITLADPFEKNIRKTLNFGHTLGHAFESAALNNGMKLLHGHAVALGMVGETYLSLKLLGFPVRQFEEITEFIFSIYKKYFNSDILDTEWQKWIKHDKKRKGARLNFTLLKSIGKPVVNLDCDARSINEIARFLKNRL